MDSSGFSRARRKTNYVIFLIPAPDSKGLNTCVCICVCEILLSKYDAIYVFWRSKMEQNYFSYYLPEVLKII